jgi:hypothetical protein
MAIETLSLNSSIAEQISLNSGISSFVTEETEMILSFDGSDFYEAPVMTDSNADFELEVDIYIPNFETSVEQRIFAMYQREDTSYYTESAVHLFLTHSGTTNKRCYLEIINEEGSGISILILNSIVPNDWNNIRVTKSGTSWTLKIINANNSTFTKTLTITENFNFDYAIIGGLRSYNNGWGELESQLLSGAKIKNLKGDLWKFGGAYTDIAKTTLAEASDNVAVIVNIGTLGDDFTQETANARGLLDSYFAPDNKSLLSLESSLL